MIVWLLIGRDDQGRILRCKLPHELLRRQRCHLEDLLTLIIFDIVAFEIRLLLLPWLILLYFVNKWHDLLLLC